MAAVGVAVAIPVAFFETWPYSIVCGWSAAALTFVLSVWFDVGRFDAEDTRTHSTREDPGVAPGETLVIGATLASIVAVALLIFEASEGGQQLLAATLAFISVCVSWTLIHTQYMLRYARMYYSEPVGGIDFNTDEDPRYVDFAYLAFTMGMTYQVSDTDLRSSELRGVVLRHSILSYAFGTLVLASVVNLVVGLA